jgi:large subunit ribosomal protein L13
MPTNVLKGKDIKREWHLIDVKDQILGRAAVQIACLLVGKGKPNYVPYLDNGDYVVVVNAAQVRVTGKKAEQKVYFRHSGYPGGDKSETFTELINRRPEAVIEHAIKGMLPKNKLAKRMVTKLHIFAGEQKGFERQLGLEIKGTKGADGPKGEVEEASAGAGA